MQKKIVLSIKHGSWIAAQYTNGEPCADIISLFNTHEIPTAFTAEAKATDVQSCIQKLNPDAVVEVA